MKTQTGNQMLLDLSPQVNESALSVTKVKSGRNYGIDFLRLVSMFYVVVLHTLRQGGISNAVEVGSSEYIANWFLQISAFCAVNIFALISGYVSYSEKEKSVKFSNYFNLWFQVVFYGCIIGAIMNIINPDSVTKSDYIKMFFPVSNSLYWYFTAYTGLFFISPVINAGIRNTDEKTLKRIFVFLIVIFSVAEIITKKQKLDGGYSFAWLLILYTLGGIMRKCDIGKKMKTLWGFAVIIILNVAGLLWKLYGTEASVFGFKINQDTFILYTSPLVLGTAIMHVIAFSKISFSKAFTKIIAYAAPCSFAVYLINTQYYMWNYVLKGTFAGFAENKWYVMVMLVFGFSVAFVVGSVFIDRIRMLIFRLLRINKLSGMIEKGIQRMFAKDKQ